MGPEDNSSSRVIVHPVLALDAHRVGDFFLPLHESDFHGHPGCATVLPHQVALLYTLIEYFGPNQVVGVPPLGDPRENLSFARLLFPETLHSCLALPYILRFILIHKVPESSLPPRYSLPQVPDRLLTRATWEPRAWQDWWPVFHRYRASADFPWVPEERTVGGSCLHNGVAYRHRPLQDHRSSSAQQSDWVVVAPLADPQQEP